MAHWWEGGLSRQETNFFLYCVTQSQLLTNPLICVGLSSREIFSAYTFCTWVTQKYYQKVFSFIPFTNICPWYRVYYIRIIADNTSTVDK